MENSGFFLALLGVGLAGSPHCIGMCGGIVAALGTGGPRWQLVLGYNLGRISSYVLAGALVGLFGNFAADYLALQTTLRTLAGVMLILMGLYMSNIWRVLTLLERAGQSLWGHIQPLILRLGPARSFSRAVPLGMLWGWLPCGLVYSALGTALATGSVAGGALAMLGFGLGTLPAMFAGGWFAAQLHRLARTTALRTLLALALIGLGSWTVWQAQIHAGHQAEQGMEMQSQQH